MDAYGLNKAFIPEVVPNFSAQGTLTSEAASELGLVPGIPLTYRAGDQPNNAFSLNVLHPGEVAATAGTSGVVYGVSDQVRYDPLSRVNTFAHVNHSEEMTRLGVLLCINGTGILNSWLKRQIGSQQLSYDDMNTLAAGIKPGSEGLSVMPFGNGAERMISNKNIGCVVDGLDFNRHTQATIFRASQEGIVFAFHYGMEIMKETGITPKVIRAGHANMFLSEVFAESLASVTGAAIELYNTDGSQGAARAAGIGCGIYKSPDEAFDGLQVVKTINPDPAMAEPLTIAYQKWKTILEQKIRNMKTS
jgi:xylulokinase